MNLSFRITVALALALCMKSDFAVGTDETSTRRLKKAKKGGSAQRAITMWWVLFNKPSQCITDPSNSEGLRCGMPDVMAAAGVGATNVAQIAIVNASGGIPDANGKLRMVSTIYKSSGTNLNLEVDEDFYTWGGPKNFMGGFAPASGEETEVHIVIRDHGPVVEENKIAQITTFTDPSCTKRGGPNLCVDSGAVAFAPPAFTGELMETKDIGCFPMFCPDTAATDDEKSVQLKTGEGNEVTVKYVGDSIQVVTEITVPGGKMGAKVAKKGGRKA